MITDKDFWKSIVSTWIIIQSAEERKKTISFAEKLAEKQLNSGAEKVPSIFDELFGEEE